MRTVSTLCASGAGIGTSAVGLALVTNPDHFHHHNHHSHRFLLDNASAASQPETRTPSRDMSLTTTTVFTFSANAKSSKSSPAPTYRFTSNGSPSDIRPASRHFQHYSSPTAANTARSVSENAVSTLTKSGPDNTSTVGFESGQSGLFLQKSGRRRSFAASEEPIALDNRLPRRRLWLRRFSNSMSSSRDSSRTPSSRPTSAAISNSNGSIAFSTAAVSTTPIFPANHPANTSTPHLPPNKLVKRSTSVRSIGSQSPSHSKLPRPTFKRPATSHQRSSLSQRRLSDVDPDEAGTYTDNTNTPAKNDFQAHADHQWRPYFVPRVAADAILPGRRRASSIPNPIKRVFPDRRYQPVLVSASEPVARSRVEVDDGFGSPTDSLVDLSNTLNSSVASSPVLLSTARFEQAPSAKRSFSIGDFLPTTSQPQSSNSQSNRGRTIRRSRRRISSASNSEMGSTLSIVDNNTDSERPTKRRETSYPDTASPSLPTSIVDNGPVGRASIDSPMQLASSNVHHTGRSPSADASRNASLNVAKHSLRQPRSSVTTPDVTSDSERRSFSDSNTDYQSEMLFDSIPTRTTRSTSGRRGPPIDTIFDETPPSHSSGRSTKLRDFLNQDNLTSSERAHRYSTIEEEESVTTPVRSVRDRSVTSSPSVRGGATRSIFPSSPPFMQTMPDPDSIDWDAPDDFAPLAHSAEPVTPVAFFPAQGRRLPLRFAPVLKQSEVNSATSTPNRHATGHPSIFDWSEVQPSPSHNQSPPRPKTVHGKKDSENRSSRTTTRRTPSAMHSRSHSVPAVPDSENKRSAAVHNKFGTWGVGSKAVTEDWNEDFDFEDLQPQKPFQDAKFEAAVIDKRIDSGHEMLIPQAIREQQENVVANISLLRDWGLLIEELKELRIRAVALDMLNGPYAQAWSEVDAMIELADQETEEHTLEPRRSPPSSPGFDYSAFEEALPDLPTAIAGTSTLPGPVLPIASVSISTIAAQQAPTSVPTRPRKDSEAVARSVIEAIQQKRSVSDPANLQPVSPAKKVPFDTATLRHIVPYVSNLRSKVKEALRETEGLYKSPLQRRQDAAAAGARRDSSAGARRGRSTQADNYELDPFDYSDEH